MTKILACKTDMYNGIHIDKLCIPDSITMFEKMLIRSMVVWREKNHTAVWLTLPEKYLEYLGIAFR